MATKTNSKRVFFARKYNKSIPSYAHATKRMDSYKQALKHIKGGGIITEKDGKSNFKKVVEFKVKK